MIAPPTTEPSTEEEPNFEFDNFITIQDILAMLHRHYRLVVYCTIIGFILALIYNGLASPLYTASTSILIDPRQQNALSHITQDQLGFKENLVIDSQIEVIKSNKLLEKAAVRANIYAKSAEETPESIFSSMKELTVGEGDIKKLTPILDKEKLARFNSFRSGVSVQRVGRTFVIKISYSSGNPKIAANRANLVADTYLEDEIESQYEIAQRTNEWLKVRLEKLRKDLSAAEQAVEDYKEKHGILQISNRASFTDQQLYELNTNLAVARSEAAKAKAQYDLIQSIIKAGDANMVTSDSLRNTVITKLRNDYIALSRRANEIKRKQGADHQAYRKLQQQMNDIQAIIIDEYVRLAGSYQNAHEIAMARAKTLTEELEKVRDATMVTRRSHIELRELERRAESTRNLYKKLLDNSNVQAERQSFPQVHARIINYAMEPNAPSWPKTSVIILTGLVLGAVFGLLLVFVREKLNRYIWKTEELEAVTKRTCLGMLPKVIFDNRDVVTLTQKGEKSGRKAAQTLSESFDVENFKALTHLLDQQTNLTSEVMRNVQLATQFANLEAASGKGQVISFVSANSGEGKSVTSCFLAKHLALAGKKVALIDCDFRRPSLTDWFSPNAHTGFYELASRLGFDAREEVISDLSKICHKTDHNKLFFIPAKGRNTSITNLNLVASGQMNEMVEQLKKVFDVIIIDLPPIIHIADARVIANVVTSFVFLTHWGKTDREVVRKALTRSPEVYNKTVGTLLTLVDTDKASQYGYYSYDNYYQN